MDAEGRLAVERDCIRLSNAFAYHLDHREYRALADLFLPDGIWVRHGSDLSGRAAIVAALAERPAVQFTRHVTTGHYFMDVTEARATCHAYNVSYGSFDAATLPATLDMNFVMLLDFADTYAKTDDGWRFAKRISTPVLIGDGARAIFAKHP